MKTIIYCRVSTDDKAQDPEVQVLKCKQYCELHNHKVVDIIKEEGVSGDSYIFERPNGKKILSMIKQGRIEGIVVFSQDRFSRESPVKFLQQLNYLKEMGVTFISVSEPVFNMEGEFSEPLKYFLSWFSNYFLIQHKRKVQAGIEKARKDGTKSGKAIGRPTTVKINRFRVQELKKQGLSLRQIAKEIGTNQVTIYRLLQKYPIENEVTV